MDFFETFLEVPYMDIWLYTERLYFDEHFRGVGFQQTPRSFIIHYHFRLHCQNLAV